MERIASLFGLLLTIGRYLFLFLLYRFLWQLLEATRLEPEEGEIEIDREDVFLQVTDLSVPEKRQCYPLGSRLTVGRDRQNQVLLTDPYAEGRHLLIERRGEQFLIKDLNTTFGSLLDGRPLSPGVEQELPLGGKVMIGTTELMLVRADQRLAQGGA